MALRPYNFLRSTIAYYNGFVAIYLFT